jgi:hypothetical protein
LRNGTNSTKLNKLMRIKKVIVTGKKAKGVELIGVSIEVIFSVLNNPC